MFLVNHLQQNCGGVSARTPTFRKSDLRLQLPDAEHIGGNRTGLNNCVGPCLERRSCRSRPARSGPWRDALDTPAACYILKLIEYS